MPLTYTYARAHLAEIWDEVENAQEPAIITRKGHEDLAILPTAELASLRETAHLLRSPRNAARLLAALHNSRAGRGDEKNLVELAALLGLDSEG
jgi:antitoxin YefM